MITIPKIHRLTKVGPASTAAILPKTWVDRVKATLGTEDIDVEIFGDEFLVITVSGLPIKNKEAQAILKKCKKYFSVKRG